MNRKALFIGALVLFVVIGLAQQDKAAQSSETDDNNGPGNRNPVGTSPHQEHQSGTGDLTPPSKAFRHASTTRATPSLWAPSGRRRTIR